MSRRIVPYRLIAVVALLGLFDAWDWMPLRVAQRDVVAWAVRVSGYSPTSCVFEGSPALAVEGRTHYYSPECTYLDLLMIVAPLLWVFGASRRSNILRIAIAALAILVINLIRTWAAVYFDVLGVDRFYTHDLPDYIIWWPTVAVVLLLALRRDFRDRCGSPLKAHATEPASEGTVDNACAQAWRRCSPSRRSVRARSGAGRRDA